MQKLHSNLDNKIAHLQHVSSIDTLRRILHNHKVHKKGCNKTTQRVVITHVSSSEPNVNNQQH